MEEKKNITLSEVLKNEIVRLSNIMIPAAYVNSVGIPIAECIGNLKVCVDALSAVKEDADNGED